MSNSTLYFVSIGVAAAVMVAVLIYISRLKGTRLYLFRNVYISSLSAISRLYIVMVAFEFGRRHAFTWGHMLLEMPARFAMLSISTIAILFVLMAVTNIVLIKHEGIALKNTVGTILELLFLLATFIVYALVCVLKAHAKEMTGAGLFVGTWLPYYLYLLIDYAEAIMIGTMTLGWLAAHGKSKYDKDFIIIPGCCISKQGRLMPLLRGRVNRAIRYAWDQEIATGKPVKYIPSGGQGPDEIMSEGSAMAMYLLSHSAEEDEVLAEKQSRNTAENFLFSAKIIREQNPDAKVAFATTNYHVLRCGMLAKKAGLDAEGLASSTKWYFWPNGFAREIVAIWKLTWKYHAIAAAIMMAASLLITWWYL